MQYWGVSEWIAPVINLVITIPLNFILNKFWTFKQ
ncbi:MAG: GtrA family protein [Ruthenibacterium sp.]